MEEESLLLKYIFGFDLVCFVFFGRNENNNEKKNKKLFGFFN